MTPQTKNIWFICQNAGSVYHGMVFRPYYLGREFVNQGHNVSIFCSSSHHLLKKEPTVEGSYKSEIIDKIRYIWIKTRNYKKSRSLGRIWSFFEFPFKLYFLNREILPKPDVIIVSSPPPFPLLIGVLLAKKYNAKIILDIRDIWPLTLIKVGHISQYNPLILLMRLVEVYSYKRADHIVAVLRYFKDYIAEMNIDPVKVYYIPNGININDQFTKGRLNEITDDFPKNKFLVGYAGTIGLANDNIKLIQVAKLLKNDERFHFVLVGDGQEKHHLEQMTKDFQLKNVSFYPSIPKKDIHDVLKYFDVCYVGVKKLDLYKYGISTNKLFDYMLAQKPILMALYSKHDFAIEAKCGISIYTDEPEEVVAALNKFIKMSQEDKIQLGRNGYDFLLREHAYENLALKYNKLFEK